MSTGLFLAVFAIYILGMIALSVWVSRKQKSGEDFLLGNRGIPFLLMLGTTVATLVGTGSSMGAVGKGYSDGLVGMMYGIGGGLGTLLLAYWFGDARRHQFMTFSEEMSYYYRANRPIQNVVAVLILLASIGWLGAHILGGGMYLAWIAGVDLMQAKLLVAAGFGIYVIIGGYIAVVWTDTIQAIVLFIGFIWLAVISLDKIGGFSGLGDAIVQNEFTFLQGGRLLPSISLAFVICVGVLATPAFRQRIYSSNNVDTAKRSFYYSGILYLLFSLIPALVGIAAFELNPTLENSNYAFPFMATEVLPLSVGILVLIAGLSATMSSASSDAIAGVSILLRDIYILVLGKMPAREQAITLSRWGVFGIVLLALLFSLYATDIIDYIKYMISIIMSGMVACVMMGKFWSRATWQGGIAALIGGAVCALTIMNISAWDAYWGNPSIPSVFTALMVGAIVSEFTQGVRISSEEALKILSEERQEMEMKTQPPDSI
ncbi:MAG: sodium:solute symporter family protein [Saprospiraceae bacterium]|nr:sodium:solute symporter family protein [Saprospiraceae bacterium]